MVVLLIIIGVLEIRYLRKGGPATVDTHVLGKELFRAAEQVKLRKIEALILDYGSGFFSLENLNKKLLRQKILAITALTRTNLKKDDA